MKSKIKAITSVIDKIQVNTISLLLQGYMFVRWAVRIDALLALILANDTLWLQTKTNLIAWNMQTTEKTMRKTKKKRSRNFKWKTLVKCWMWKIVSGRRRRLKSCNWLPLADRWKKFLKCSLKLLVLHIIWVVPFCIETMVQTLPMQEKFTHEINHRK